MHVTLKDIQDTVAQYAEVIAQVINVDVEIVDHEFVRLAGTGFYRDRLNENMANEGFVFRAALESGETQIVKDPGHNRLCISCPSSWFAPKSWRAANRSGWVSTRSVSSA